MFEESSLFEPQDASTLPGICTLPFAKQKAAPAVYSTLCHPVCQRQLQLFASSTVHRLGARLSLQRNTVAASLFLWLRLHAWNKCAGEYLAGDWGISRISRTIILCYSLAFVPKILLQSSCSCPSEEGLKLVNLWASFAPHGPQPALL